MKPLLATLAAVLLAAQAHAGYMLIALKQTASAADRNKVGAVIVNRLKTPLASIKTRTVDGEDCWCLVIDEDWARQHVPADGISKAQFVAWRDANLADPGCLIVRRGDDWRTAE
jgi:hypothetical protein